MFTQTQVSFRPLKLCCTLKGNCYLFSHNYRGNIANNNKLYLHEWKVFSNFLFFFGKSLPIFGTFCIFKGLHWHYIYEIVTVFLVIVCLLVIVCTCYQKVLFHIFVVYFIVQYVSWTLLCFHTQFWLPYTSKFNIWLSSDLGIKLNCVLLDWKKSADSAKFWNVPQNIKIVSM